jgi:hypothetical protein
MTEKETQLADLRVWEGRGKEPNHTTARKPDPLLYRNLAPKFCIKTAEIGQEYLVLGDWKT